MIKLNLLSLFFFVLFFFTNPLLILAQSIQYSSRFPKSRLYNLAPSSLGLDNIDENFKFSPIANTIRQKTTITNIVPGDFNYDGNLDMLVMSQPNPGQSNSEIKLTLYFGNGNDSFDPQSIELPSARHVLPMILDLTGDMKLDILGYPWEENKELPINQLATWMNMADDSTPINHTLFNVTSASNLFNPTSQCTWSSPHSNAFVDLDGDCLADVVFVCENKEGFKLSQSFKLPTGAGPLTFADMDGDGTTDILFTTCDGRKCMVHILYNQQIGLCSKTDGENLTHCRYLPVPIHAGDYNLDGYPDLLITTNKKVMLLQSDWCTSTQCTGDQILSNKRTFSLVRTGAEPLTKMNNPRHATFFDIDEDGSLDILILDGSTSTTAKRIPNFVINNYFNDAFFIKGLVSNGALMEHSSNKPYGVNYPGATFKFTVLDTSGTKHVHQVPQLPQTSYLPLQTPYCLFGLGRTNNYVEEMFAGITRHQKENYIFYEGVIPNSQLVFLPYQPEKVKDSSTWKVELYIQPADYIPWVLVSLVAAAIILGTVVGVLYYMEKREDERERRKALHIINFDAL
ncbi:hypothetical protein BJ944DRAFT_257589 [Cunninghamella echinulata]|nr:hypothetical protein BJ944DRAFT_257589 [Cunninghamella echinulata]